LLRNTVIPTHQPGNIPDVAFDLAIQRSISAVSQKAAAFAVVKLHFTITSSIIELDSNEVEDLFDELTGLVGELGAIVDGLAQLSNPAAQEVIILLRHMITLFCCQVSYVM